MATRSKRLTRRRTADDPRPTEHSTTQKPPPSIRKGIYLSALIYIEGDQPAPEDFAAWAKPALKQTLTAALEGNHNGLSMTLKKLEVQNDVEEDDENGDEEKFQF